MPGIQDLLALAQGGGGGGGAPMPQGPPQGGGGGMGGALVQKLQELMQDPVAMKGMQQYMMGMGGGMGAPGAAQAPPTPGPQDVPPGSMPPGMEPPAGAPMDDQQMVSDEIDRKGATWDGVDAPTQNDIERLQSDPSSINIKSFNEQFGEGAAEKYIEEETSESPSKESSEGPSDEEDASGNY
jgi:hypothetical protein